MYEQLSLSKLMSPVLPPTILYRQALVSELTRVVTGYSHAGDGTAGETGYKVVLLCAPGGYGKTTLLADFARRLSIPCCWYFLDATDEDVISFLTLLMRSIRQRFPQFGTTLEVQLRNIATIENQIQMYQQVEIFIDKLIDGIATEISEHFVLFLCDYQEIDQEQTTNSMINRFVQHLPSQCTLILESRSSPNLEFISLLASRQIFGMGSAKLRFSAQEIHELARLQQIDMTDQEAQLLEQSFEGWITGILLGTHLGGLQIPLSTLASDISGSSSFVTHGREYLFAYLVKNIFAHKSEAYHFLKETSLLPQMTPMLCNTLLGISDAAVRLAHLENEGLFVVRRESGSEQIFVCHPILRDLLYNELKSQTPEHLTELHIRAVEFFRKTQPEHAITHALAAQTFVIAAQLIESMIEPLFAQGRLMLLASWIDSLPAAISQDYSRLLLARANIFLEGSALKDVQLLLEQALVALKKTSDTPSLQAEIFLAQAKLFMQRGDYVRAQNLSRQALSLLAVDEIELRATTHRLLGSCAIFFNNFTAGITEVQQALQLYGHDTRNRQVAKLHGMLASFYGLTDRNVLSEHHYMRAIQYWKDLSDEWGLIDNLANLGSIKLRQGALSEAEQLFTQALAHSRGAMHYECGEAYALAGLGDLYQYQDKFGQTLLAYEDSLVLARRLDDAYLTHYVICQLTRTYQLMGDPHSALHIIAQLDDKISLGESTYNYEQALYVLTLGTVLLQTGDTDKAYTYLTAAKSAFAETKYEQIQAMIRRAACLLAQDKFPAALDEIAEALQLGEEYSYEALAQREIARCPDLLRYLKISLPMMIEPYAPEKKSTLLIQMEPQTVPKISIQQALPVLRIQALGIPAVYRDDVLIKHWRMARSMELFFLLLNAARPLHKEQIITYLWRDGELPTDPTWRSTVHYLRKTLEPDCLKLDHGVYTLQLETMFTITYDVDEFRQYAAQAQVAQSREDTETARKSFEKLIALYQGDFLCSFYSDWCAPQRDELRQTCLDAHRQLALLAWQQQQLEKSIFHWQHIVAMDNMLEFAHEGLMRCYLRQGKRNQALRHYNYYVTLLQDELRMAPGQPLQLLYQQIMQSSQ